MWGQLASMTVGAGANIYGGIRASKAAGAAANIQAGQAQENADLARALPYRLNPYRQQSAEQWSQNVRGVYDEAAAGVEGAAGRANEYLDPYNTAGGESTQTLLDMARSGLEAPQEKFQFSEDDPGYQWRLEQGQKALERSAAARGTLFSGGTGKALTRYAQGAASQEYQAAFDRFMGQQKHGLEQQRFYGDTLSGLASRGLTAGTQMGNNLTGAARDAGAFRGSGARYQSDMMYGANEKNLADIYAGEYAGMGYMTDKATAQAGGQVGQANAFNQMLSGGANAISQGLTLGDLTNWGRKPRGGGGGGYQPWMGAENGPWGGY